MNAHSILIADANPATRDSKASLLAAQGYGVHSSDSADRCLELASSTAPDLVLANERIPDSGRLCRELRTLEDPPAVLLLLPPKTEHLDGFSADGYLPEKSSGLVLLRAVAGLIELRDLRRRCSGAEAERRSVHEDFHRFAARVAHDFAEPLRNVNALAQMFHEGTPGRLTAEESLFLGYLVASMERVRASLQSVLAYTQLGTFAAGFGPTSLALAADAAANGLRARLAESGAKLCVSRDLPTVQGNLQQLQALFYAVMDNALVYRRPEAAPEIKVEAKRSSDSEWLMSVTDNGMGIAPQYHKSVFEPFHRLHGRDIPGSGLGLALARKIVEGHRGRIWLESELGQGTQVYFTLPA